jgi:L-asparagine transporter-like permease
MVKGFNDELIKKYPLWLTILTMATTFSLLRLSRVLEYPYWYGLIAVIIIVPIIYQIWFKIRDYKLHKLESSLRNRIKNKG